MPNLPDSIERTVRERLAAADRRRRTRKATHQVWRIAPAFAAGALGLALVARWTSLPTAAPFFVLFLGTVALLLFVFIRRRDCPVSDAAATAIDNDAGMQGELRSANWFVHRETRDSWADFHLLKAAEQLQTINWTELYPALPARRSQVLTGVLVTATIVLMLTIPEHVGARPTASAAGEEALESKQPAVAGRMLDPELQRQLEELLAAAARGNLPTAEAVASDTELRDMLDKLSQLSDAELLEALKRALAANPNAEADARLQSTAENLKRLAEQAKRAGEAGSLPKELQDALEKLSDQIELAKSEGDDADAASSGPSTPDGQMTEGQNANAGGELSIQFAKTADAGGGAGVMMMSSPDTSPPGGPPGSGVGGSGSDDMAASTAAIEAALKQETVEASQDSSGKNVETDIRRKTEHGTATVTFTGSRSGQFDSTRAAAPPPVPEARRTGVQTYFVRKPQ